MKKTIVLLSLFLIFGACTSRVPSNQRTQNLSNKYFNKYAKKYDAGPAYASNIQEIEVKAVQELQKNLATSLVILKLEDGNQVPVILTLLRKVPLGWRITGWELAQP